MLAACSCEATKEAAPASIVSVQATASLAATHVHSEDCSLDHGGSAGRAPPTRARSLTEEGRKRLTALRVSAHVGSVSIRKHDGVWKVTGRNECLVPTERMERALEQLSELRSLPTTERPLDGRSFELQIVALAGEERVLHLDVADRAAEGDLVQLPDSTTYRVQGLDRELWSPRPLDWCTEP